MDMGGIQKRPIAGTLVAAMSKNLNTAWTLLCRMVRINRLDQRLITSNNFQATASQAFYMVCYQPGINWKPKCAPLSGR